MRDKLWANRLRAGPEPLNAPKNQLWKSHVYEFSLEIKEINQMIDKFNLLAPALHLQTVHYDQKKEVRKVLTAYRDLLAKDELPKRKDTLRNEHVHHQSEEDRGPTKYSEIWKDFKSLFST